MSDILIINLRLVGLFLMLLISANFFLPGRYGWRAQLAGVSPLLRQVFWSHFIFIVLLLAMMAVVCLGGPELLIAPTALGRVLAIGLVTFWGVKLLTHLTLFDSRGPRGDRTETVIYHVATAVFVYFTAVFAGVLWIQGGQP